MTPDLEASRLDLVYEANVPPCRLDGSLSVEATVAFGGQLINRTRTALLSAHVETGIDLAVKKPDCLEWMVQTGARRRPTCTMWSSGCSTGRRRVDTVGSYFAMREIRIDGPNILLNGRPLYQRLILDQGYWKDSHLTPPSEAALVEDIDKIHALGYNGLRKHQKIEDERFLLWCDVKGMLVVERGAKPPTSSLIMPSRSSPASGWRSSGKTTITPASSPGRPSTNPGASARWRPTAQSSISPRRSIT